MTRRFALAVLISLNGTVACSDPIDPPHPAAAEAASVRTQGVAAGKPVTDAPSVRVTTQSGRPVPGIQVRFAVVEGGGSLTSPEAVTGTDGIASAGSWMVGSVPGRNTVIASVDGFPDIAFEAMSLPDGCDALVPLDIAIGDYVRLKPSAAVDHRLRPARRRGAEPVQSDSYPCLLYDAASSAGSEYVLLLENVSPAGGFNSALFTGLPADTSLSFTIGVEPLGPSTARVDGALQIQLSPASHDGADRAPHTWDFGAGEIREHVPEMPPAGAAGVEILRGGGALDINSVLAAPAVGDTIQVLMEAIPHLNTSTETQKAVIRFISDDLIIAEDVRLTTTLRRERGGFNTPLTDADMAAIAAEYSAVARVQSDLFFQNRHNLAVESRAPARVTAVHSIMPAEDIWGYTYSVSDYFVWDFWVATDGVTRGLNQHPQRVADNLFMHEVAHMRHLGMLQHSGKGIAGRGHRWLVEGFARFAERLPTTARILGTTMPSRTDNIVLPRNPAFGNAYFLDDVPTYLQAGSSMYHGYDASSFVFDYFADQVAITGGDWMQAVREFLLAGAAGEELDAVVQHWLPGVTFTDLFTRARIALYTDDLDTPGLPAWTQYHQFRLRESRPAPDHLAANDPRVQWARISPTTARGAAGAVGAGAATGLIIEGSATGAGIIRLSGPAGRHAIAALARIR